MVQSRALDTVLRRFLADNDLPGATVAARLGGARFGIAVGQSDAAGAIMPIDAMMPAGSVGKTLISALALHLAQTGDIDLDAPISKWLSHEPWFARLAGASKLTLRLLLTHRAGLADHRDTPQFAARLQRLIASGDADAIIPPEDLVALIADAPLRSTPGAEFFYSETGYVLAGLALQTSMMRDVFDVVDARLLAPLHLSDLRPARTRFIPRLADGLIGDNEFGLPLQARANDDGLFLNPAGEFTGGGFVATAASLADWGHALYSGAALPGDYLGQLLAHIPSPQSSREPRYRGYCLGGRVMATPNGQAFGHHGDFPGYLSLLAHYPSENLTIAAQINAWRRPPTLLHDLQDQLHDAFLRAMS